VDTRPPPPITIEGGPGWTTDPTSGDTIVTEPDDAAPGRPGRRRQVTALLLAAALGFGAATLLAERRQSVLDASPDGVLSLDVASREPQFSPDLVELDGGLAVQATVQLRNTGPRDIALEAVELEGTGFAAVDVAGRRLAADRVTAVQLLRAVRCEDLAPLDSVGPLRVRATTGAGPRTAELRLGTQEFGFSASFARAACGLLSPDQSLVAFETAPAVVSGGRAEVRVALSSASSSALVVQSLELPPGLRLASLTGVEGTDVTLPLRLPPGDYDPPTQPMLSRGQEQSLVAVLEVADCAALPARAAEQYLPLFQAAVTDERGRSQGATDGFYGGFGVGGTAWGDPAVVDRLRASSCPARESALTTVPPGRP
jgi:hypothetical protein